MVTRKWRSPWIRVCEVHLFAQLKIVIVRRQATDYRQSACLDCGPVE